MRHPPARQHLLGACCHVGEHEFHLVAVLVEIGAGDNHDDRAAVGRNLRIGESHDLADLIEPESLGGGRGGGKQE